MISSNALVFLLCDFDCLLYNQDNRYYFYASSFFIEGTLNLLKDIYSIITPYCLIYNNLFFE